MTGTLLKANSEPANGLRTESDYGSPPGNLIMRDWCSATLHESGKEAQVSLL